MKAFDKKIPIKLVAYDDQSNTATASTLYNQLITQDKVDILVADSGSVLTAPAVPIARDHKMFLFDQTGTGASFFSKDNPYIALMADPVSTIWPKPVADFISQDGPGLGIKKVAILYSTNEFTGTQANAVPQIHQGLRRADRDRLRPGRADRDHELHRHHQQHQRHANPDAVIHFGYAPNDIAFLRNVAGRRRQVQDAVLHLSGPRDRTAGEERRRQGARARLHLRAAVGTANTRSISA